VAFGVPIAVWPSRAAGTGRHAAVGHARRCGAEIEIAALRNTFRRWILELAAVLSDDFGTARN
jgi:hypothetical protein